MEFVGMAGTERAGGRMAMFEDDPNTSAAVLALGLLAVIGLIYGRAGRTRHSRILGWTLIALVAVSQVRTGSRGGAVALAAGLLVFVLRRGSINARIRNALIVVLTLTLVALTTLSSERLTARWEGTLEEGSMAGRERIFPAAWGLFLESPVVGWGPVVNYYLLAKRLSSPAVARDTHNLYLAVLTETGLVGGIVYFLALGLCVRAAWIARAGPQGVLPLAMLSAVLVVNLSLTWQNRKLYWFVLAFALASAEFVKGSRQRFASRRARAAGLRRQVGAEAAAGGVK
jgi:O-antigen ligase